MSKQDKKDESIEIHPAPNSLMEAMKIFYQAKARGKKVKFIRGKSEN